MAEEEDLTGGVESTFLYAFHMQYQALPAERTTLDLQVLRASSLHATDDLMGQVADSAEMVSGPKHGQHPRQTRGGMRNAQLQSGAELV
jgi:hypothetical protein